MAQPGSAPGAAEAVDSQKFLSMFNVFLEQAFAVVLEDFASENLREFRKLVNEQLATEDYETHNHRYYELYRRFKARANDCLTEWCATKGIPKERFEATVNTLSEVKTESEDESAGAKPRRKSLVVQRACSMKRETDLEAKQLLKGFLAATEYQSFMEFMVAYVAEMEESELGSSQSENAC